MILNERTFENQLKTHYPESYAYWNNDNEKYYDVLVNEILLDAKNIRNMVKMCEIGHPPLEAIAWQIEEKIAIDMNDENIFQDEVWKRNVGKLVATVVSFFDYYPIKDKRERNVQMDIKNIKRGNRFHFSSIYQFQIK